MRRPLVKGVSQVFCGGWLETGMPGVFAAGDARHRSIKRVAPAVGEGSVAANSVREYLNFGSRR